MSSAREGPPQPSRPPASGVGGDHSILPRAGQRQPCGGRMAPRAGPSHGLRGQATNEPVVHHFCAAAPVHIAAAVDKRMRIRNIDHSILFFPLSEKGISLMSRATVVRTIVLVIGLLFLASQSVSATSSSCSTTSEDGSESCSISCPEGQASVCKKFDKTVECLCEE